MFPSFWGRIPKLNYPFLKGWPKPVVSQGGYNLPTDGIWYTTNTRSKWVSSSLIFGVKMTTNIWVATTITVWFWKKKSHPMVIKDFGVFRQDWVMESWATMIIASPLIVWVCVVVSFLKGNHRFTIFIGYFWIFTFHRETFHFFGIYIYHCLSHWVQAAIVQLARTPVDRSTEAIALVKETQPLQATSQGQPTFLDGANLPL